jgi:ribosomal protein S18 acetylase RimI-like enzyme
MIRKLQADDREQLVSIINGTNNFNDKEKEVAVELIDDAITNSTESSYIIYIYEDKNNIAGYYCIGKRELTDGVYDLYWIVVDNKIQNKGIGKSLLEHAESFVNENNGRWILAETSSQNSYNATRNFYLRNKYSILCQIKDFYTINDDLIIFGKHLNT